MDKYVETLDALMKAKKEKKKKEPTIKEKEAFRSAWLGLVADTGLTGRAEQYLYEGFAFCGAEPFYAYLIQTEDPNATLATLFGGKYYGIDSNVSFRLMAHLLALMLNNNWQSVCVRSLRCAASAELLQSSLMLMTTDSKDTICLEIVFRSVM